MIDAVDLGLYDAAEVIGHIIIVEDGVEVEIDDGSLCGSSLRSFVLACCVLLGVVAACCDKRESCEDCGAEQ